jgi:uncharacterized protein YbjT (DUF2867 family)
MSTPKRILVTGATGLQGGAVARALLERGHAVRAFVRKPDAPAARALADLGAELAQGDLDDAASITRAAEGTDAVFVMATPFGAGKEEAETRQAIAAIEAARKGGTGHVVYSSVSDANDRTGVPHFESKRRVEEHLEASSHPYTIVGPVYFMENVAAPWNTGALRDGKFVAALPADRKLQIIDVRSIARFTALVLEKGAPFFGKRIDIASDERTGNEMASDLTAALGRPFTYVAIPVEPVKAQNEDMGLMFEWFDKVGYGADIAALKRDYPEVGWRSFIDWARENMPAALGG